MQQVRNWLMPINRKYNLATLMGALREEFPKKTGKSQRRVFFEYM